MLLVRNPVDDWMLPCYPAGSDSAKTAVFVCATLFAIFVSGLAASALLNDRWPGCGGDLRLILWLIGLSFACVLLFEVGWHVPGDRGNLTAWNPAGDTLVDGHLTLLGWITALRRAFVAGGVSLITGATFAGVRWRAEMRRR
ncbi:hypothetical protein [Caulobacter soli]|uniref:hypothetical protein n=1 Tax=Caulobacter soli TaxID=2708539 RepID=UPI0013E9B8A2|nr:hypothetical protein [Caulobacter soli]